MSRTAPRRPSRESCTAFQRALECVGAIGRAQAMPRREVLTRFRGELGDTVPSADRCLRALMSVAPDYGIPVVSSNDGYYVAVTPEDFETCIADLASRRGELSRRIGALESLRDQPMVGGRLF